MRRLLFWTSALLIGWTYIGFPLVVLARARLSPVPIRRDERFRPTVSMLIAARNEIAAIGTKLDNCLALDYPADRLEVIVASDGSDDGTNEIVATYADRRVRLLALPRVGKAAALEAAVATSTGEVLVFSDANSEYEPRALLALVAPLADPSVGGVAGNQRYRKGPAGEAAAEGERAYWNVDRVIKVAESAAGSTISATGAIYAVRRELFDGVPEGVTDDFAVSTAVIAAGRRLVFASDAVAWESISPSGNVEWGRKVRVITRGLRGVWLRRQLMDPRVHGFYAVQLLSHKVLRRLMGVPLMAMGVLGVALWRAGTLYRLVASAEAAIVVLGLIGLRTDRRSPLTRLLSAPAFFLMANAAALSAVWNVVRGHRIDRWEPARADDAMDSARAAEVR